MGVSYVFGVGSGVGRMVHKIVWCATGCSGVDWSLLDILGGRTGGVVGISTLGGWSGVCNGDGGGAVAGGRWAITPVASGGFSLGAGWVFCSGVKYGIIGCGVLGRKISWMQVRASKHSVCRVARTSLMAHDRKCSAWTMWYSGVTVG